MRKFVTFPNLPNVGGLRLAVVLNLNCLRFVPGLGLRRLLAVLCGVHKPGCTVMTVIVTHPHATNTALIHISRLPSLRLEIRNGQCDRSR